MIPESEWIWHGLAGHFIGAHDCCFRLNTEIGDYAVSTVGCWHSVLARGDEPQEIGSGRTYETMVFRLEDGQISDWTELDSDAYNDGASAERGHMAMCRKFATHPTPPVSGREHDAGGER